MKVFVSGASGNVGRTIVRRIAAGSGIELVGGWCMEAGEDLGTLAHIRPLGVTATDDLAAGLAASKPDVAIDFSSARVLEENMRTYLQHGLDAVIGTTGVTDAQLEPIEHEVVKKGLRWTVIPNYGLGINLVSKFIREARKYYPYVTITDQHTNQMANAPSGTAVSLARAASEEPFGEVESAEVYPGVLGGDIGGVRVFSQRLPWPGPYSGHEITLARKDEVIRISVQDYTSEIYMDGLFLALKKISALPSGSFVRSLSEVMD